MNERIQELAEQSRIKDHWSIDEGRYLTNYLDEKKFAELLIMECADVCDSVATYHDDNNEIKAGVGAWDCRRSIKQHFGVKE